MENQEENQTNNRSIVTLPTNERLQMQQIRELEMEQLEVEEVDSAHDSSSSEDSSLDGRGDGGAGRYGGFTFDTSLAPLHTYLGEVDDIHHRRAFLDEGALLDLPMFYLEGIVLFPEATLPLRVIQPRFKAAVERAMQQEDAPNTLGVIHVRSLPLDEGLRFALVGTTAEIRQYRRLEDGSINVVTRGQQRFRLRRCWTDVNGAPCAQVQIIQEDAPLHIPKNAFGSLASVPSFQSGKVPRSKPSNSVCRRRQDIESEEDELDDELLDSTYEEEPLVRGVQRQPTDMDENAHPGIRDDELSSSDEENVSGWWRQRRPNRRHSRRSPRELNHDISNAKDNESRSGENSSVQLERKDSSNDGVWGGAGKAWAADESKWKYRAQISAWPHWVYRMYDAYSLARRAADMWRQMVETPSINDLVKKPDLLSFYLASKIPVPDSTRQELLEIDGVVYRLQREIQLLESIDRVRCKLCRTVVARRRDMLVMSTDGPIGAYVNAHGFVHEILTLYNTRGLALEGRAVTEHSWFPGYAWTIANCSACDSHMGWLFTAVNEKLEPKSFWGVRRSQLADST
uniref:Protein cereblon n=1 Tax=Wollemia nobilis TaxID=56998 RepID=A0A0C9RGI6_9CONI